MSHSNTLDVDSIIERLLSVRGQPNNRTVQLAEGEIRALCASARGTVEFEFVFFFVFAQRLLKGKARKSTHAPCSRRKISRQSAREFRKRYDELRTENSTEDARIERWEA